jgi:hypothetical protein
MKSSNRSGLGEIQAVNLVGWNGNESAPSLSRLISDIAIKLGRPDGIDLMELHKGVESKSEQSSTSTQTKQTNLLDIFLDAIISFTKQSSIVFRWIVAIIFATFIISLIILHVFARLEIHLPVPRVVLIVLVIVSVVVLALSTILSWFRRRRKNGSN